jgi:PAS domain S-box-containing protein
MVKLSSKQAILYSSVIFLLSAFLNYFFPGQNIIGGGFIISIFLTVFIEIKNITAIVAFAAAITTLFITASKANDFSSSWFVSENIFVIIIIALSSLVVVYLKYLLKHIEFDKIRMISLFENAAEGIILTNGEGKIVLVNPSTENIFGYKQEELTGELIEVLIPARFRSGHDKMRNGFYQHPQNRQMGVGRDLLGRKKDGTDFPLEVSLSYYKQNNEAFVIAFVVDITARKNIELNILKNQSELENLTEDMRLLNSELEIKVDQRTQILTEALQKLEQSQKELSEALDKEKELNEIKSRFVSMASHEFRTPLSTVLSSASLLSKYTITDEQDKRDKHIHRIKDSVKHLNDILEDFLSLGKLDEGKVTTSFGFFDLNDLLKDVVDEMKRQTRPDQKIEYFYEGNSNINSDKKLLRNIVINLISNAIKFSDEEKTIWVNCKVADDHVTLSIKDEGIGISEEDQQYLYSSFFRGKNAVNIQGTGMGLHIVKRYVSLLNGSINLQTGLQEGTIFTVLLPVPKQKI